MPRKEQYAKDPEYHKALQAVHRASRTETYRINARKRSQLNRKILMDLKEGTACTDCGQYFPYYVMEFDHVRDKQYKVSSMTSMSTSMMLEELAKCEVVCANCHNVRTHFRRLAQGKDDE